MHAINLVKHLFSFRPLNFFERVEHQDLRRLLLVPMVFILIGGWFVSSLATVVLVLFGGYVYSRYRDALEARVSAIDCYEWEVKANQVSVGKISDAQYAEIVLSVLSDWRTYWHQAKNLLLVTARIFDVILESAPKGIFWVFAATALFAPDVIVGLILAIQHATAADIEQSVKTAGLLIVSALFLGAIICRFSGPFRFGFSDKFGEAIREKLRLHFSLFSDSSFVLFRNSPIETCVMHEMPESQSSADVEGKVGKPAVSVPKDGRTNDK